MTGKNGLPFTPAELKLDPCPCGTNHYVVETYVQMMIHRFRTDIKVGVKKERYLCSECGKIVELT